MRLSSIGVGGFGAARLGGQGQTMSKGWRGTDVDSVAAAERPVRWPAAMYGRSLGPTGVSTRYVRPPLALRPWRVKRWPSSAPRAAMGLTAPPGQRRSALDVFTADAHPADGRVSLPVAVTGAAEAVNTWAFSSERIDQGRSPTHTSFRRLSIGEQERRKPQGELRCLPAPQPLNGERLGGGGWHPRAPRGPLRCRLEVQGVSEHQPLAETRGIVQQQ